ncbi:hypothetical protein AB0D99_13770 [Streptomyces sp. NPDC047971]|uniref:hypothetical protein n=1 Tax=Streptomyces sp. NPDC047971 TaxID=3154499 RepID=UPI0033F60871
MDDEPVFKKSTWGTSRYVYNANNPLGLALIIASVGFALLMLVLMENQAGPFEPPARPTWSHPADPSWSFPSYDPPTGTVPAEPAPART